MDQDVILAFILGMALGGFIDRMLIGMVDVMTRRRRGR